MEKFSDSYRNHIVYISGNLFYKNIFLLKTVYLEEEHYQQILLEVEVLPVTEGQIQCYLLPPPPCVGPCPDLVQPHCLLVQPGTCWPLGLTWPLVSYHQHSRLEDFGMDRWNGHRWCCHCQRSPGKCYKKQSLEKIAFTTWANPINISQTFYPLTLTLPPTHITICNCGKVFHHNVFPFNFLTHAWFMPLKLCHKIGPHKI